jgi:hypothetical protein
MVLFVAWSGSLNTLRSVITLLREKRCPDFIGANYRRRTARNDVAYRPVPFKSESPRKSPSVGPLIDLRLEMKRQFPPMSRPK